MFHFLPTDSDEDRDSPSRGSVHDKLEETVARTSTNNKMYLER